MRNARSIRQLSTGEADLHWMALRDSRWNEYLPELSSILSADEVEQARAFKLETSARDYILCRGFLRQLLSHYTGCMPSAVVLSYTNSGKPYLRSNTQKLHFNLSHSGGFALYAFNREAVGVDIEKRDSGHSIGDLAHLFLSDGERPRLAKVSVDDREAVCLRIWARKEAVLKGIGVGLVDEMRQITVWPGAMNALSRGVSLGFGGTDWIIYDLDYPDVLASVALPKMDHGDWEFNRFRIVPHCGLFKDYCSTAANHPSQEPPWHTSFPKP